MSDFTFDIKCKNCGHEHDEEKNKKLEKKIGIYEKALSEIGEDTYEPNSWTIYKSVIAEVAIKALKEGNEL